jgi:hypothetical protein
MALREGGPLPQNGRRPRSGRVSDREIDPEIIPRDHIPTVGTVAALGALAEALPPVRRRAVQHPEEVVHPVVLVHVQLRQRLAGGEDRQQQRAEHDGGDQLQSGGRTRRHAGRSSEADLAYC